MSSEHPRMREASRSRVMMEIWRNSTSLFSVGMDVPTRKPRRSELEWRQMVLMTDLADCVEGGRVARVNNR